ncbi:MAG: hypothetical protein MMC33_007911, partial [Icmadophila ericetorum]|nr:hypothetical protein [Icmadophila ericetorum]
MIFFTLIFFLDVALDLSPAQICSCYPATTVTTSTRIVASTVVFTSTVILTSTSTVSSASSAVSSASSTTSSISATPTLSSSATPTSPTFVEGYTFVSCYSEPPSGGRALTAASNGSAGNIENCAFFCYLTGKYQYFGVEYYGECYFGNSLATGSVPYFGCGYPCDLNASESCGGSNVLDLYNLTDLSVAPTLPPPATIPLSSGGYNFDGCYHEPPLGARALTHSSNLNAGSVDACAAFCSLPENRNTPLFGVEYFGQSDTSIVLLTRQLGTFCSGTYTMSYSYLGYSTGGNSGCTILTEIAGVAGTANTLSVEGDIINPKTGEAPQNYAVESYAFTVTGPLAGGEEQKFYASFGCSNSSVDSGIQVVNFTLSFMGGDIAVYANSEADKKTLEEKRDWVKALGFSATMVQKTFPVVAHGIRVGLNTENPEATAKELMRQNEMKHPGLVLTSRRWHTDFAVRALSRGTLNTNARNSVKRRKWFSASTVIDSAIMLGHAGINPSAGSVERNTSVVAAQREDALQKISIAQIAKNQDMVHGTSRDATNGRHRWKWRR